MQAIATDGPGAATLQGRSTLTLRRWLVLLAVMLTASVGDTFLAVGMRQAGPVSLAAPLSLLSALRIPWVAGGIVLLIGFFASYLTALSWADLTFVLPATSLGYIVVALLSKFWLQEHVSLSRWAGILLIVAGVGFIARGPSLTEASLAPAASSGRSKWLAVLILGAVVVAAGTGILVRALGMGVHFPAAAATWGMILAIVITATAGDVLTAGAMRRIGDLDEIRARAGMVGAVMAVVSSGMFLAGVLAMALSFFALLFALSHADVSLVAPASASLTFVSNALAAKLFLKENVDRRRWLVALLVCCGVALLAR